MSELRRSMLMLAYAGLAYAGEHAHALSQSGPKFPVSNVEKAAEYCLNALEFQFDWGTGR